MNTSEWDDLQVDAQRAIRESIAGNVTEALQILEPWIARHADDPPILYEALLYRATVYEAVGRWEDAWNDHVRAYALPSLDVGELFTIAGRLAFNAHWRESFDEETHLLLQRLPEAEITPDDRQNVTLLIQQVRGQTCAVASDTASLSAALTAIIDERKRGRDDTQAS